ncbi:MAG: F0F1 ATP synthase subunit A [Chloroflexota bacterium]|nr:F0F1 ATP synthase subunit A [Chloroflexota bacterium]
MLGILFQTNENGDGGIDLTSKLPHISIKAEVLFDIPTPFGPLHFTNSMLYTLIVIAALVLFFAVATRRMSVVPRGSQNFAEAVVEFLLGTTEGTAGRRVGRRIFPLIATLFIFIIAANWSGLLPGVGTIGGCYTPRAEEHAQATNAEEGAGGQDIAHSAEAEGGSLPTPIGHECPEGTEFIPFFRAANADLNTTLGMALIAVLVVQVAGIASHGVGGYVKELVTPVFLAPIHIMGEISRIISLSFRLFGNIFGGEVLVTVMFVLLGSVFAGFGAFIFLGLEVLFGFIQALLFSLLTLVFISTAVAGHGGGHGPEEAHGTAHGHTTTAGAPDDGSAPETPSDQATETASHMGG